MNTKDLDINQTTSWSESAGLMSNTAQFEGLGCSNKDSVHVKIFLFFFFFCCSLIPADFKSYPSWLLACDCPSASETTLKNMGKYFSWSTEKWLHDHNKKAQQNPMYTLWDALYEKRNPMSSHSR